MIYGIRSLKNGTGSVLIGASIILLSAAMPTISGQRKPASNSGKYQRCDQGPTETETRSNSKGNAYF